MPGRNRCPRIGLTLTHSMDLIADIGATNARCALVDAGGRIVREQDFKNADFDGLETVLDDFLRSGGQRPERAALAIAAPVTGDEIAMTNIGWRFSRESLGSALGLTELRVLNDFEALAHALPALGADATRRLGGGEAARGACMAVLGPGSGLGVAALAPHGDGWTAIAGEGGHVSVGPMDTTEAAVIADHRDASGHCSAERLLSGPGLVRIHASLGRLEGVDPGEPSPAEITERAERGDTLARRTYEVFLGLLGGVAGNLALTVGARGGVFIGGGIVPRVLETIEHSRFRERFIAKGRYRAYLDAIPTAVITLENPAFVGLKSVLGCR